jgi:ribosomal protein S18 acetylase RimI-like enzyme
LLHERAEAYFRSWEARRIELHVSPTNAGAVRFYQAMGYAVVGREGDMLRMRRSL